MAWPATTDALPTVRQDADGNLTESFTIPATPPYTYRLGSTAPLNLPAGYQIIPPSGVPNIVSVAGGGYGSWSRLATGSTLSGGTFSCDDTTSPTGGICTFASTDAGKAVTVTYTGSVLVNEALIQGMITAQKDERAAVAVANGLATLNADSHTAQPPAVGVRQSIFAASTSGGTLAATTFSNFPFMTMPQITTTTNGRIRCRLSIVNLNSGGAPLNVAWQVIINGVTYSLGSAYIASTTSNDTHGYVIRTPVLPPGTYTAQLQYQLSSAVNVGLSTGNLTIELDEVA